MAINPIIHNDKGIHRFQDYLSQIPGFLKGEEDVVVLMQLFSDYINNAYRNITVVKKFEFKLISVESRIGITINRLNQLANIFIESDKLNTKMLYLAKPLATPTGSNECFMGMFDYNGTLAQLTPSIINFSLTGKDGSRVYVNFTGEDQESNSGSYVYNESMNTLSPDPHGSSQDPFLGTPNEPISTIAGLTPRAIEFSVNDISPVRVRKVKTIGTTIYYEVFFTAMIDNLEDVPSTLVVEKDIDADGEIDTTGVDYRYLVDYYNVVDPIPSSYRYKYIIDFAEGCHEFDWFDRNTQGYGLFYSRDITQYKKEYIKVNRDDNNFYIDPSLDNNTVEININTITGDGSLVTVKTVFPHNFSAGDIINIEGTSTFDDTEITVVENINLTTFSYSSTDSGTVSGIGLVIYANLFYTRDVDDGNKIFLKVPYKNLEGTTEFAVGDTIVRVEDREELVSGAFKNFKTSSGINLEKDTFFIKSRDDIKKYAVGDKITLRTRSNNAGIVTFPTGLDEGILYEIETIKGRNVHLKDIPITSYGSSTHVNDKIDMIKLHVYFDASADVDITDNTITLHQADSSIDPLEGLETGSSIRLRGVRAGVVTLPTPLTEDDRYFILDVDKDNNTVTLTDTIDGTEAINITVVGAGIVDFLEIEDNKKDVGTVESVSIRVAGSKGTLTLSTHVGDLISRGVISKLESNKISFRADINTTAVPWDNTLKRKYKKGTLVTYDQVRYKLNDSIKVNVKSKPPTEDSINYLRYMDDIAIAKKITSKNPYMFGMYRVKHLEFEEEPNFNDGFNELSLDLYIEEVEDIKLKYGHDQREWVFDPRLAPKDNVVRNGYMEAITDTTLSGATSDTPDIVEGNVDHFVKAETSYGLPLKGTEVEIERNISSLTYDEDTELATAVTATDHRLGSGWRIDISGAIQTEYNGRVDVTVIDSNTFTYSPITTPSILTATGSPAFIFRNIVDHDIEEASNPSGNTFQITTEENNGYNDGSYITIEGTTNYDGRFGPITIVTNNTFTFTGNASSVATETPAAAISFYKPVDGDYIEAKDQSFSSENGTYTVRESSWEIYDSTKITNNTVLFTRQNLFDVTDNNPAIAKGKGYPIRSITRSGSTVTVRLYEEHNYSVGSVVNIDDVLQIEYNGKFEVSSIDENDPKEFEYEIKSTDTPNTPGSEIPNKTMTCQSNNWYKYTISDIQWQQKSNSLTYSTATGNREYFLESNIGDSYRNDLYSMAGEYGFQYEQVILSADVTSDTITLSGVLNYEVGDTLLYTANGDVITGLTDGATYTIDTINSSTSTYPSSLQLNDSNGVLVNIQLPISVSASTLTQTISATSGDLINADDQFISTENGKYRVEKGAWRRLDRRLIMKVRDIDVDSVMVEDPTKFNTDDPMLYKVYSNTEVNEYIEDNFSGNLQVYKVDNLLANNAIFEFEKIDNMDTTASYHQIYDGKFDKNSVSDRLDMDSDFVGVPDMDYPLVEKIERLVYLKDPNVIDYQFIGTLARYMGYDVTSLLDDVTESVYHKRQEDREKALRKTIQNLPQFNTLKSTESGIETMLLTFGIVADVVTLWTDAAEPYKDFIPEYLVRETQYSRMIDGEYVNLVATPHFKINVDIEGNFDNQLNTKEVGRIITNVKRYKPINTVFDGIVAFLKVEASTSITISDMNATGRMSADVGFDEIEYDFEEQIGNDCI